MRHPAFRHLIRGAAAALAAVLAAAGLAAVPAQAVTYSISGKVSLPAGAPTGWLADVRVYADRGDGWVSTPVNATTGTYTLTLDQADSYWVMMGHEAEPEKYASSADTPNLQASYYPGSAYPDDAVPVAVNGPVTGINATLEYGLTLSGTVTMSDGSSPEGAYVYAFTERGDIYHTGWPEADGSYTITGLRPDDQYYVYFSWQWYDQRDNSTFTNEYWQDAFRPEDATLASTWDGDVTGIDNTLDHIPYMPDAYGSTFHPEIEWLASTGITQGWRMKDGTYEFRPFLNVNRDQMAAFLYRMSGSPDFEDPAVPTFADVPVGHVFYTEIEWLATQGITNGWEVDGVKYFRPTTAVNRDVMAAFLYRFAGEPDYTAPGRSAFKDVPTTHVFYDEIAWLAETGVTRGWTVSGGTEFRPATAVKRDVMAAFLYRFSQLPA